MRRGVVVRTVINRMVFDGATKDPMQQAVRDALIAFWLPRPRRRLKHSRPLSALASTWPSPKPMSGRTAGASPLSRAHSLLKCGRCSAAGLACRRSRCR